MKKQIIEALQKEYPTHIFGFTETRIDEKYVPVADLLIDGVNSKFEFSPQFLEDLEYTATHDVLTFDPKQELIEIAKVCVKTYLENLNA